MFPTLQMMATSSVLKAGILTPDLTNHPVLFPFLSNTSIDTTELLQVEFSTSSLYVPIYDVKPSSFGIGCYFTISPRLTFVFPYADCDLASIIQSEATEDDLCMFVYFQPHYYSIAYILDFIKAFFSFQAINSLCHQSATLFERHVLVETKSLTPSDQVSMLNLQVTSISQELHEYIYGD